MLDRMRWRLTLGYAGIFALILLFLATAAVIGFSKPRPEAYLAMARALGVAPEACLFVDDRPECVEGARQVGMRAWLLDRRGKSTADNRLRGLGELFDVSREAP